MGVEIQVMDAILLHFLCDKFYEKSTLELIERKNVILYSLNWGRTYEKAVWECITVRDQHGFAPRLR